MLLVLYQYIIILYSGIIFSIAIMVLNDSKYNRFSFKMFEQNLRLD